MNTYKIKATALQAFKFGCIGGLATLIHAGVGYLAVTQMGITGLQGNVAGYLCAWWVSFFGHHAFTFQGKSHRMEALMRFIPHSVGMFIVSLSVTGIISVLSPAVPQSALPLIGAGIVPLLSFLSSKFFVFRV